MAFCPDAYETARESDALVVLTEWNAFKHLDLPAIKALTRRPVLIDGRNIYDISDMKKLGFVCRGVGRAYGG